jgi:hypothetical protein
MVARAALGIRRADQYEHVACAALRFVYDGQMAEVERLKPADENQQIV